MRRTIPQRDFMASRGPRGRRVSRGLGTELHPRLDGRLLPRKRLSTGPRARAPSAYPPFGPPNPRSSEGIPENRKPRRKKSSLWPERVSAPFPRQGMIPW